MKILVLGATGLLGNSMFRVLSQAGVHEVFGTIRNEAAKDFFIPEIATQLIIVESLENESELRRLLALVRPHAVINCTAFPRGSAEDFRKMMSVYSILPRRLEILCRASHVRLIHFSSDGVFNGSRGRYTESDIPDANDSYGILKMLGEVEGPGAITLRTSVIGHELSMQKGLVEWFLSQNVACRCYTKAIFSGLPAIALAKLTLDFILPSVELQGIYHVASQAISKFDLLSLVGSTYGKQTEIIPDDTVVFDRSLLSNRLHESTGYKAPPWPSLIKDMYEYKFGLRGSDVYQ